MIVNILKNLKQISWVCVILFTLIAWNLNSILSLTIALFFLGVSIGLYLKKYLDEFLEEKKRENNE